MKKAVASKKLVELGYSESECKELLSDPRKARASVGKKLAVQGNVKSERKKILDELFGSPPKKQARKLKPPAKRSKLSVGNTTPAKKQRRKPLTREQKSKLFEKQQGRCYGCGEDLRICDLTDDHIKPLAQGGTNDLSNRQLLCNYCNKAKKEGSMKELRGKLKTKESQQDRRKWKPAFLQGLE